MRWMRYQRCREPNEGLQSLLRVTIISPKFRCRTLVRAFRPRKSRKFLNHFSQQRRRAWDWDCPLHEPSSRRMRVRYGRRTKPRAAPCFTSDCRLQHRFKDLYSAGQNGPKLSLQANARRPDRKIACSIDYEIE